MADTLIFGNVATDTVAITPANPFSKLETQVNNLQAQMHEELKKKFHHKWSQQNIFSHQEIEQLWLDFSQLQGV